MLGLYLDMNMVDNLVMWKHSCCCCFHREVMFFVVVQAHLLRGHLTILSLLILNTYIRSMLGLYLDMNNFSKTITNA